MSDEPVTLSTLFEGWDGYQTSLLHAVQPLTPDQLAWRPAPWLRSVGEVAAHIALGRVVWFARMPAPGSLELEPEARLASEPALAQDKDGLVSWLVHSWQMIADTLQQWTVRDLSRTYRQEYGGKIYSVSYQWTIWRILTHDTHHGGELSLMLGMQGIEAFELGNLGGHLTMPPLAA